MSSYLPPHPGPLPIFLLPNSSLCFLNTAISFFHFPSVRSVYQGPAASPQVTHLPARAFGIWTFVSGFVRLYAAYNITNHQVYALATLAYVASYIHYTAETFLYRTTNLGMLGTLLSFAIDGGGLLWLLSGWKDAVDSEFGYLR
ncbi:hypothetical protein BDZ45DRAFT_754546 [Acephala macrosclerotiorum]|nr:hypothetical protein BDZ45DRAFT_754546 [Acephala macrosclerotiorum]